MVKTQIFDVKAIEAKPFVIIPTSLIYIIYKQFLMQLLYLNFWIKFLFILNIFSSLYCSFAFSLW